MSDFLWSRQALLAGASAIDTLVLVLAALALAAGSLAAWRAWTAPSLAIRWWSPIPERLERTDAPYGAKAMIQGYPEAMRHGVSSAGTLHILLAILGVILLNLPRPDVAQDPMQDSLRILPPPMPPPRIVPEGAGGGRARPLVLPDPRNVIPVPTETNVRTIDPSELVSPTDGTDDGSIWDRGPAGDGSRREPGWPEGPHALVDPDPGDFVAVEQLPELVWMAEPTYPEMARLGGLEGTVELLLLVDTSGRVKTTRTARSIVGLDAAAVAAAMTAKFKPALWRGRPVTVWVALPIKFSLH